MSVTRPGPNLSAAEARHIDQICDRFEAAWQAGGRPDPADYLGAAAGPVRAALLRQLLLLDWDYRGRSGGEPRAGDYHACFPGDAALIEAVWREACEAAASTVVGPQARAPDTSWSGDPRPGPVDAGGPGEARADRYELLGEVGQGGTGLVFRARDRLLGRELALKVLREAYRDHSDARRRFLREAQVGSQLQHPAIVPVYGLGWFDDRRLYLTMKLVEGHTLAELLRERADPRQDLTRLLSVYGQVCQAMAYAHVRGVVHRDLKPSNVMVGAFGEVQVMDWGFAKQVRVGEGGVRIPEADGEEAIPTAGSSPPAPCPSTGLTQSGALMGTPAYMPPEQARGEAALIDARADVFALGAILCEILTGQPPYAGAAAEEVCRQAAAGDLHDAHARLDACEADPPLRDLARLCLAAERADRPPDAGILAEVLAAYLASAQERLRQAQMERAAAEARAEEAQAKARAERRARRLTLALGAVVVLFLLGAAAAPAVAYVLLREEQAQTEAQRKAAVAAREEEARRRQQAWRALDLLTGTVVKDWLVRQPVLVPDQKKFLEQALAIYTEFAAETSTDEASQAGLARSYSRVGDIQWLLRRVPEADVAYDRGAALFTRLAAQTPGRPGYRKALVQTLNNRILILEATGRDGQADAALRDLIRRERQMVAEAPDVDNRYYLAHSLTNLSIRCRQQGKFPEALALARESLALHEKLAAERPDQCSVQYGLGRTRSFLGRVLEDKGQSAAAERAYRDALKLQKSVAARCPINIHARQDLANTHAFLARLLQGSGRLKEAEAAHRDSLEVRRQLVADFPGAPSPREDMATTQIDLANVLTRQGRHDEAVAACRSAIALYAKLTVEMPGERKFQIGRARAHFNFASLLGMMQRPKTAAEEGREAVRLFRALAEAERADPQLQHLLGVSLGNLAAWHYQRGEWAEARRLFTQALSHNRAALRGRPDKKKYPQALSMNLKGIAGTFLGEKQHARGAEAAGEFAEAAAAAGEPEEVLAAAAMIVLCVELAEKDARLTHAARAEFARSYAERALTTLRLAVKHGYRDAAFLRTDPAFARVRARPDFQQLLAELEEPTQRP
jgi:tetratricopeptide (TPR) repeat protein